MAAARILARSRIQSDKKQAVPVVEPSLMEKAAAASMEKEQVRSLDDQPAVSKRLAWEEPSCWEETWDANCHCPCYHHKHTGEIVYERPVPFSVASSGVSSNSSEQALGNVDGDLLCTPGRALAWDDPACWTEFWDSDLGPCLFHEHTGEKVICGHGATSASPPCWP